MGRDFVLRALTVSYPGARVAVDGVDLRIGSAEIHGLAGESGAGKTTLALAALRLVERFGAKISGEIWLGSERLDALPESQMRSRRGRKISMIFQNAQSALNPVLRVGAQLREVLRAHERVASGEVAARSSELLASVQLPSDDAFLKLYPSQLSGGMAQRLLIAMAIAHRPDVLVADEPTSALDVTTQAEIIRLFRRLRDERGFSMLFISHDLALLGEICDSLTILRNGRVVETGLASSVLRAPREPYTKALLEAVPRLPV